MAAVTPGDRAFYTHILTGVRELVTILSVDRRKQTAVVHTTKGPRKVAIGFLTGVLPPHIAKLAYP